ncbi:cryptochrome/photolyase family protein [Chenggangzhangella methanolivorans]|uniref:Deoxyribodipyrimidine photo-lyase n=1 Tax=Chenggangzhangella methanolivorans TaxID=1437009 RepID=A0A9E6RAW0_9HYPH|nr:deoxyribodipyrimidine photo-lyase [Chenggangzhangella methanolivorans]QZN99963.1 DNA photolyase family protein [Chenggangzhangella methanolivorans]
MADRTSSRKDQPSGALVWLREDLRLADNPALAAAIKAGGPVTALYVHDEETAAMRPLGGASRWWLARSLKSLAKDCEAIGLPFAVRCGKTEEVIREAVDEAGVGSAFWNRRYFEAGVKIDERLKSALRDDGFEAESFNGRLLNEPWEVKSKAGEPLKVYTPYWRAAQARGGPRPPLPKPTKAKIEAGKALKGVKIDDLGLEPSKPDWAGGLRGSWTPGEAGARKELQRFLDDSLKGYASDRDRPDRVGTSRLSPHLCFGEVSPFQLWHSVEQARSEGPASPKDVDTFRAELGWREFNHHILFYNPKLATENFQKRYDEFPWGEPDAAHRKAWTKGLTGYPIVDAGMRQLWTTGWMHNRVRMITASFLIKHLMIHWRDGEEWFWDTLVDADHANNPANWQWVAGSGADAAPYFRVFNPTTQGEKFDPKGDYVRAFVPELSEMPAKWIHTPWEAPDDVLAKAGVTLGQTYPKPIVDHAKARGRALAAFDKLKSRS